MILTDEDEELVIFIACGGGRDALRTLIWRVRLVLSSNENVATLIASGMLRVGWSALALAALLTRALSSSSLLVMLAVRCTYVVAIIPVNREDIDRVTCVHNELVAYFFPIFNCLQWPDTHRPIYQSKAREKTNL